MFKYTAAIFPSQPTALGSHISRQASGICLSSPKQYFIFCLLPTFQNNLLFPVIKQVIFQGIRQRQTQDLFPQKVYRGIWLQFRGFGFLLFSSLILELLAVVIIRWVGDPTSEDLFVQENNSFHATATHTSSFKSWGVLQPVSIFAHCFLMYNFFNGSSDGYASQILEAANSHWG